jgi:hypothetical protein
MRIFDNLISVQVQFLPPKCKVDRIASGVVTDPQAPQRGEKAVTRNPSGALAVINDDASLQAYDWYEQSQSHECPHYALDTPRSTGSDEAEHAGHRT